MTKPSSKDSVLSRVYSSLVTWEQVVIVTACAVVIGLVLASLLVFPLGDVALYRQYAANIWAGAFPYHGQPLEYPPGVLPFILLAQPVGKLLGGYTPAYVLIGCVALCILVKQVYASLGRIAALMALLLVIPMASILLGTLDIFSAVFLFGAFAALKRKRYRYSALLLGASVLVMGFPVLCLPFILICIPKTQIKNYLMYFSDIVLAGWLPFVLISPSGVWQSVAYHLYRPPQIESSVAAVGFIFKLFGYPVNVFGSHKSYAAAFNHWQIVAAIFSCAMFAGVISLFYIVGKSKAKDRLALGALASLLVFIIFFKVGSPQYFVLVMALAAIVSAELPAKQAFGLWARLMLISILIYAILLRYWGLVHLRFWAEGLVIIKYVLLVELLVWTIRKIRLSAAEDINNLAA